MADEVLSATDLLGNAGKKQKLTWQGQEYTVSYCCPTVIELMEDKVLDRLFQTIEELEKKVEKNPKLATRLAPEIALLQSHISGRQYGYMQTYYQQVAKQSQYQPLQLWAMIADNHPKFTLEEALELVAEEPEQVMTVMGVADPGFFDLLAKTSGLSKEYAAKLMLTHQESRKKASQALKMHFQSGSGATQGSSETLSASALPK